MYGIVAALISVLGTLIGTILGWMLNNYSRRGKLVVHLGKWEDAMMGRDLFNVLVKCSSKKQAEWYSYELQIDIFNSSGDYMFMRNIHLCFKKQDALLFIDIPKDEAVEKTQMGNRLIKDVGAVNIPPKNIVTLRLCGGFHINELFYDEIWRADHVCLEYEDIKGVTNTFDLVNIAFDDDYFMRQQYE